VDQPKHYLKVTVVFQGRSPVPREARLVPFSNRDEMNVWKQNFWPALEILNAELYLGFMSGIDAEVSYVPGYMAGQHASVNKQTVEEVIADIRRDYFAVKAT
jgi:hypothetical protein